MSKYYILIVEESIKSFSVVGHGNECLFTFAAKGQTTPFEILEDGDKIIGYISNDEKRFAYIFNAKKLNSENECKLVKCFESACGPTLNDVSDEIKSVIYENENTKSFIQIEEKAYSELIGLMMEACANEYNLSITDEEDASKSEVSRDLEKNRLKGGTNTLLYGVPGCGKSFTIMTKYCKDADEIERVVFHPDYTYGDFVGQILPLTDAVTGKIRYEFSAGLFTRILSGAYNNPEKKYCLIIEEINRGNAPAIFGDIFQLLDRDDNGSGAYEITNADVAAKVYIYGQKTKKIKLPSNLFVFATMNTSDQNVFTLDTAFQRRWNMRMVENNVFKSHIAQKPILDTNIKWAQFADTINSLIITKNVGMTSSEDKRLGAYFVTEKDLHFATTGDNITQEEADDRNHNFPEKVLKYLWDDAFKFTRDEVFKSDFDSLEKLIKAFEDAQGDKRFNIFADDIFGLNQDE